MAYGISGNGTRVDHMARKLERDSRMDESPRSLKRATQRLRRRHDQRIIAEQFSEWQTIVGVGR